MAGKPCTQTHSTALDCILTATQNESSLDTSGRDIFLSLLPPNVRGSSFNFFLSPPRRGIHDPEAILEAILSDIEDRQSRYTRPAPGGSLSLLRDLILAHPSEARRCARWASDYVKAPPEVIEQHKREQQQRGVLEWMRQRPATQRQMVYLRGLGYTGELCSMAQASELIDRQHEANAALKDLTGDYTVKDLHLFGWDALERFSDRTNSIALRAVLSEEMERREAEEAIR